MGIVLCESRMVFGKGIRDKLRGKEGFSSSKKSRIVGNFAISRFTICDLACFQLSCSQISPQKHSATANTAATAEVHPTLAYATELATSDMLNRDQASDVASLSKPGKTNP